MLYCLIFIAYGLGLWIGRRGKKEVQTQWSSKYWGECRRCYPGVVMKFGANTQAHLEQVIRWHREDHHEPVMMHNPAFDPGVVKSQLYSGLYESDTKMLNLILSDRGPSLKHLINLPMEKS